MKNILLPLIFFVLIFSGKAFSQLTGEGEPTESSEVAVEQMLGMFDGIINEGLIDNISEILPNDAVIVNYGAGDFSGEGFTDITISYKTKETGDHNLNVIFLVNEDDREFKIMKEMEVEWVDVPYDVAFSISEGTCVFTFREDKKWRFQRYFYYNNTIFLLQDETIDA
ncbi:MAG: hypothetical protein J0M18_11585 [Ignavibacteria bacterium]|jgi:hypothetical protein|nr:hypothetical protein [Ignavibacteria bacterium]